MAKPLISASLVAPAFLGLNTQDSSVANDPSFALEADNCVIDKNGRIASRKGWSYLTSGSDGVDTKGIHVFTDINGTKTVLSFNDSNFYKGTTTLTQLTPSPSETTTGGNWQAATLNDRAYFFQRGSTPLYYSNETASEVFTGIDQHTDYDGGAGDDAIPKANTVLSAYGRLWVADTATEKTTIHFSDLLNGAKWNSGTAGSLNISGIIPNNGDTIVGLGAQNGLLIVFCKHHIIIFADNDSFQGHFDVTTLRLVEVITGIGCIARDSIQNVGDDILFMSSTGLRSLGRTIQEKSQPFTDISKNVRDDIVEQIAQLSQDTGHLGTYKTIKSVYNVAEAFYLIDFQGTNHQTFVFDTRRKFEDGALRVTRWTGVTHNNYEYDDVARELLFAETNGIAKYRGFQDNGVGYTMLYLTNHFDLGEPTQNKILKRASATAVGSSQQAFSIKASFDYSSSFFNFPFTIASVPVCEYNVSEYTRTNDINVENIAVEDPLTGSIITAGSHTIIGRRVPRTTDNDFTSDDEVSEYTGGVALDRIQSAASGTGSILQIGVEATINGGSLAIQKLDVYAKQGRIL